MDLPCQMADCEQHNACLMSHLVSSHLSVQVDVSWCLYKHLSSCCLAPSWLVSYVLKFWVAVPQQDSRYNTYLHKFPQHWGQNHLHTCSLQLQGYQCNIHHHSLHFALNRHLPLKMKVVQSTMETNTEFKQPQSLRFVTFHINPVQKHNSKTKWAKTKKLKKTKRNQTCQKC